MTLRPPDSVVDYALDSLRQDLVEGRLRPGERITALEVASRLQISHIPVREAIRFLEAEGHLVRDPRKGVMVAPTSLSEAEEIVRIRQLLEDDALQDGVPNLREADFEELRQCFKLMAEGIDAGDEAKFARSNRRFHFIPYERSGQKWLLKFLNVIWDAHARYQESLFARPRWGERLQQHHAQLLEAYVARDLGRVKALMDEHRAISIEAERVWWGKAAGVAEGNSEASRSQRVPGAPATPVGAENERRDSTA